MNSDNEKATGMAEPNGRNGDTRVIDGALHVYRDGPGWITLGWPAYTRDGVTWLLPSARVEALNVPREIGERALAHLNASQIQLPVIAIPGPPDRWALLMQPYPRPTHQVLATFAGHDVGYAYPGRRDGHTSDWSIELPPTQHLGHRPLSWVRPPDAPLPPAELVITALTDALTP